MFALNIPPDVKKTLVLSNSTVWFHDAILYSRPNPGEYKRLSRKEMDAEFLKLKEFIGQKKVNMLAETHPKADSPKKEDRDYISLQLHDVIKALAIITPNAVSRMIMNLFFKFKPALYPTKMFVAVSDAKAWLKEEAGRPHISTLFVA